MPALDIDDATLLVGVLIVVVLVALGASEGRRHRRILRTLPLRMSVNGSRGKSTVTRLMTGALSAGGIRTLGKTTGTEARIVLGWDGTEIEVHRRPEGPNIGEQRAVMARAADEGAKAVVSECMAVNPEYQRIFHRNMVEVNVLVIANALDDHLEEMGPTADDVAEVFAESIPTGGVVVVRQDRHVPIYRRVAQERDAALLVANPNLVPEGQVKDFPHLVFPDHLALVYEVTRWLGIPDDVALAGMRWAPPDPFATRLLPIGDPWSPALLVNAFPANDPESTLGIWDHVQSLGYPAEGLVVIMNCREDRVSRTTLFATSVLPRLPIHTLLVTGTATRAITRAVENGTIDVVDVHDLTGEPVDRVVDVMEGMLSDRVVLGVGNLHGGGVEIIDALEARQVDAPARGGRV